MAEDGVLSRGLVGLEMELCRVFTLNIECVGVYIIIILIKKVK